MAKLTHESRLFSAWIAAVRAPEGKSIRPAVGTLAGCPFDLRPILLIQRRLHHQGQRGPGLPVRVRVS